MIQFYSNPVIKKNAPDPAVVRLADGSGWGAVVTSDHSSRAADPNAFPLYFSPDMVNWTLRSWVFTKQSWPAWRRLTTLADLTETLGDLSSPQPRV